MRKISTIALLLGTIVPAFAQKFVSTPTAKGYDSHIELHWEVEKAEKVRIYAALEGSENYQLRTETTEDYFLDFTNDIGHHLPLDYKIVALRDGKETQVIQHLKAQTRPFTDEELLEMTQEYTFRYFWDYADPNTGLAYERSDGSTTKEVTIGGSGFGFMAIIVGIERGWITRAEAVAHLNKATKFLEKAERFHGMWAHWYWAETGKVKAFSKRDNGGDIVESAFMAQALLTLREYFQQDNKEEKELRERITTLWEEMEWDFYRNGTDGLLWHWSPDFAFAKNHVIRGYNECLITYVLAASSPTYAMPAKGYHTVWAGWDNNEFANYTTYNGITLPLGNKRWRGGPLFFAHYSYLGLDPRGLSDQYANYWEQNRRQTLVNRAYCIDNPYGHTGYGADFWGLTASDQVPKGYTAHAPGFSRDHGTIAPTAALSSMPYTPNESMDVLKNLYRNHGKEVFGIYGFYDAINLNKVGQEGGHVRKNYIAIDQGPIIVMIENHRTGLLWNHFMKNKEVLNGLHKLGFKRNHQAIK